MREWLDSMLGPDMGRAAQMVIALIVVVLAILLVMWLLRRFKLFPASLGGGRSRDGRLGVISATPVDAHRKLVLIKRDSVEHLIMIGGPNDVVIESGIGRIPMPRPAPPPGYAPQRPPPPEGFRPPDAPRPLPTEAQRPHPPAETPRRPEPPVEAVAVGAGAVAAVSATRNADAASVEPAPRPPVAPPRRAPDLAQTPPMPAPAVAVVAEAPTAIDPIVTTPPPMPSAPRRVTASPIDRLAEIVEGTAAPARPSVERPPATQIPEMVPPHRSPDVRPVAPTAAVAAAVAAPVAAVARPAEPQLSMDDFAAAIESALELPPLDDAPTANPPPEAPPPRDPAPTMPDLAEDLFEPTAVPEPPPGKPPVPEAPVARTPADEIEDEMARLLSELTGKKS